MSQQDPFAGIEPRALWQHFAEFTKIPRPSGKEEQISQYVRSWAKGRGFEVLEDGVHNLVVRVPASPGRENAPVVVLQGHLDMVCERNADSPYDPEKGNIHVVRDGEFLRSEGTTLGADNAMGVCAGMSIAEDGTLQHGPLELLMTVDEETGMTGAQNLDGGMLRGRIMLNLDSEDDTMLFVGCAGGGDLRLTFEGRRAPVPAGHEVLKVTVKGVQGGHSGIDINRNRLNAIHTLARVLSDGAPALLVASIDGGSKRNAIPREASAVVAVPHGEAGALRRAIEASRDALLFQYKGLDDGLVLVIEAGDAPDAFDAADSRRLLDVLRAIPTGVIGMSQDIAGLVETSTNLGVATTKGNAVEILTLSRSSVMPALNDVLEQIKALARLAGVKVEYLGGYPGWKPNMESKALAATRAAYQRLFGADPEITAIHAGLECGLIGERVPGMDMVSFGPLLIGVHAPGERVSIPSTQKFYKLLTTVLADLSA